jgi:hypothetical protein
MNAPPYTYAELLAQARQAMRRGQRLEARRLAQACLALDASREDAWLLLAALSSPRASLVYLKRALEINPSSPQARQGMHWAIQRLRLSPPTRW